MSTIRLRIFRPSLGHRALAASTRAQLEFIPEMAVCQSTAAVVDLARRRERRYRGGSLTGDGAKVADM